MPRRIKTSTLLKTSFVVLVEIWTWVHAELFTATSDIEPLLETHKSITNNLHEYIDKEQQRLHLLKKHLTHFKKHQGINVHFSSHLGSPMMPFTIIKRLTSDLNSVDAIIKDKSEYKRNRTLTYPEKVDVHGAALALDHIQRTYRLSVIDLANGVLNGHSSSPMSASDCYTLGRELYKAKRISEGVAWMMEALHKYNATEMYDAYLFTEKDIAEHIGYAYYLSGDTNGMLKWIYRTLALKSENSRSRKRLQIHAVEYYRENIANQKQYTNKNNIRRNTTQLLRSRTEVLEAYETLCRGQMDIETAMTTRLKCCYLTESHPFLTLARIKMEQLYFKPDVAIFYDVISDEEIEHIKKMAKPMLQRAMISNDKTGRIYDEISQKRISKFALIRDEESEITSRVSRRISYFTGLGIESAEALQVANYGLGGLSVPHFDYFQGYTNGVQGNRIATVLFYMSDVTQGGATVFPQLGLSVYPLKRAALFWMNLYPSGAGDRATLHGDCPVMRGSKWVSSKWIHEHGQEFRKPCRTKNQKDDNKFAN